MTQDPNDSLPGCTVFPAIEAESSPDLEPKLASETSTAKTKHSYTLNRFRALNKFVDETLRNLSPSEIAVWLILWRDTKKNGKVRVAQSDIAKRAGTTTRTVRTATRSLEKAGLLMILYRGGKGKGLSVYRVIPAGRSESQNAK